MEQSTIKIEIQKNKYGGWSCVTYVKHPEFPNEAVTSSGRPTLKSTLWHQLWHCVDCDYKLLSILVNGENMLFDKVWDIVYKALASGPSAYILPEIKEILEV